MDKLAGRQLEFAELIQPLFERLPEIPVGEWHRFSFDVVQLSSGVQVVHIRFRAVGDQMEEEFCQGANSLVTIPRAARGRAGK